MKRTDIPARNARIIELRLKGWRCAAIAFEVKLVKDTVQRILNRAGVKFPTHIFRCGHFKAGNTTQTHQGPRCSVCLKKHTRLYQFNKYWQERRA